MRLAVHLWNMARIRKQMKKSIKSSSAKSPETQGHSLPEGLTEGSMKAGGLEPAKTGLRNPNPTAVSSHGDKKGNSAPAHCATRGPAILSNSHAAPPRAACNHRRQSTTEPIRCAKSLPFFFFLNSVVFLVGWSLVGGRTFFA